MSEKEEMKTCPSCGCEADELVKQFGDAAPFRKKYDLDSKMYGSLEKINEAFYKRCSEAVTFEPGGVSVKVEVVE